MTHEEQNALALSALPGNLSRVAAYFRDRVWTFEYHLADRSLQRFKRAGLARYDRQTRRWVLVKKETTQ